MQILWSPDLSLASPALNLAGPNIVRSLEGDDLSSYCAARLLTSDIQVFQPGPLADLSAHVQYGDDGVPQVDDEDYLLNEFSWILARFGALQRIFDASPQAIGVLLHTPEAIPSEVVASYFGFVQEPDEQERLHSELVEFLRTVVASLPGAKAQAPFFLTGNALLGRLYLEAQPHLTAQNTLALLATSGITFALPRVAAVKEGDLTAIHEKLREQRESYLEELNETISQCYDALKAGDVAEAYRLAEFRVSTKMQSEASKVERAARALDKGLLKRLGIFAIEGLPSIARAFVTPGTSWGTELGIQVLSVFCKSLGQEWRVREESKKYPLGSYVYRIRRELASLGQRQKGPASTADFIVKRKQKI